MSLIEHPVLKGLKLATHLVNITSTVFTLVFSFSFYLYTLLLCSHFPSSPFPLLSSISPSSPLIHSLPSIFPPPLPPQILALIALSLVAGFSVEPTYSFRCVTGQVGNYSYKYHASYPFDRFEETETANSTKESSRNGNIQGGVEQSAQFFVAWGSLSLFYCVVAVVVYMLVTANEGLEKSFDFLVATVCSCVHFIINKYLHFQCCQYICCYMYIV